PFTLSRIKAPQPSITATSSCWESLLKSSPELAAKAASASASPPIAPLPPRVLAPVAFADLESWGSPTATSGAGFEDTRCLNGGGSATTSNVSSGFAPWEAPLMGDNGKRLGTSTESSAQDRSSCSWASAGK